MLWQSLKTKQNKKIQITKDSEDVDNKQPLPTDGNISKSTVEINMEIPHKLKTGLLYAAAALLPSITQKSKSANHKEKCTPTLLQHCSQQLR